MNKKTAIITLFMLVTISVISFQFSRSSNDVSEKASILSAVANAAELDIKGLTCSACAITAKIVLEDHEGVISAEVDSKSGKALVKFDGDRITPLQLANLINEKTPYVASLPDESPQSSSN